MFDTDIRNVGRFLSVNGTLYDVKEVKELLLKLQDIEYELERYIERKEIK